jgi:hypothetical protein
MTAIATSGIPASDVSIQLMSPASGDKTGLQELEKLGYLSFHSINVPSEWGHKAGNSEGSLL